MNRKCRHFDNRMAGICNPLLKVQSSPIRSGKVFFLKPDSQACFMLLLHACASLMHITDVQSDARRIHSHVVRHKRASHTCSKMGDDVSRIIRQRALRRKMTMLLMLGLLEEYVKQDRRYWVRPFLQKRKQAGEFYVAVWLYIMLCKWLCIPVGTNHDTCGVWNRVHHGM